MFFETSLPLSCPANPRLVFNFPIKTSGFTSALESNTCSEVIVGTFGQIGAKRIASFIVVLLKPALLEFSSIELIFDSLKVYPPP